MVGKVRRMPKLGVAGRDLLPKCPGTAICFPEQSGGRVHCAETRTLGHGPKSYDDFVLLCNSDRPDTTILLDNDLLDLKTVFAMRECEVSHSCFELEFHTALFEPFVKWKDHRIVLVVYGTHYAGKRIETGNHVSEAHQIAFELDCAMPGLKSEGGTPHVPEVRLKERRIKLIGDPTAPKEGFWFECQSLEVENVLLAQTKTGTIDPVTISKQPRLGGGLHRFVPVKYLLRCRPGSIESRNRRE